MYYVCMTQRLHKYILIPMSWWGKASFALSCMSRHDRAGTQKTTNLIKLQDMEQAHDVSSAP